MSVSMVAVRPVATVAQLAHFLLSGGYAETPSEYLDETEIQKYLEDLLVNVSSIGDAETSIEAVIDMFALGSKLDIVSCAPTDLDTLVANFVLTCSQHPAACVISFGDTAMCIVGYDGVPGEQNSRYFFLVADKKQLSVPRIFTVSNEYQIQLPQGDKHYSAVILQSKCYTKQQYGSSKGKEEEIAPYIKQEPILLEEDGDDDSSISNIKVEEPTKRSIRKVLTVPEVTQQAKKRRTTKK